MHRFWNQKDLNSPPVNRCKVIINKQDVEKLKTTILSIINKLKGHDILHKEAAILSRLIYRMKFKFRLDKGFKNMEKVNHCLLQYLNMNFVNNVEIFLNTFDEKEKNKNNCFNLPTQQMLEFILVKLQGLAALFCHIVDLSCIAGFYFKERISLGQAWTVSVIAFSLMSRILAVSKDFTSEIFQWYDFLQSYHSKFKPKGVAWLPDNYIFPKSLNNLLTEDWFNTQTSENNLITLDSSVSKIFNLIKETELILDDNYDLIDLTLCELNATTNKENTINVNDNNSSKCTDAQDIKDVHVADEKNDIKINNFMSTEDIGVKYIKIENVSHINTSEQINSKNSPKLNKKSMKKDIKQEKSCIHSHCNINDIHTLEFFMKKEDKYRKMKNSKSLSSNLKEPEWKMLQKVVIKYMNKILSTKSVKKSKKIINNIKTLIDKAFEKKLL